MEEKILKTAKHHWWPRGLLSHWSGEDGLVGFIRVDGVPRRTSPFNIGGRTNAHHVKLGGPWSFSFEQDFDRPDSEFGTLVKWLNGLSVNDVLPEESALLRIRAQAIDLEGQATLARAAASLLARSPRTVREIERMVAAIGGEFHDPKSPIDANVVRINQSRLYRAYFNYMSSGGRWAVLYSDSIDFIAGDGVFSNFPAMVDGLNTNRKLILPLTPEICVVYARPRGYPSEPILVTMKLGIEEVEFLNHVVQIYSGGILLYREKVPELKPEFEAGEFLEFKYHKNQWIDWMLDNISQYNFWGKDGAPIILNNWHFSS